MRGGSGIAIRSGALVLIGCWDTIGVRGVSHISISINIILCIVGSFLFAIALNMIGLLAIEAEAEINTLLSSITRWGTLTLASSIQLHRIAREIRCRKGCNRSLLSIMRFRLIMVEIDTLILLLTIKVSFFFQIIVYTLLPDCSCIDIGSRKFIRVVDRSIDQFLGNLKFKISNLLLSGFLIFYNKLFEFDNKVIKRDLLYLTLIVIYRGFL